MLLEGNVVPITPAASGLAGSKKAMSATGDARRSYSVPSSAGVRSADPILTEILRHWLVATADEMSVALVRSAYSTWGKESQDASAALLDAEGRLIAQASGTMLMHAASLRECLREVLRDIRATEMTAGDVYVMNDPYRGGSRQRHRHLLAGPRRRRGPLLHRHDHAPSPTSAVRPRAASRRRRPRSSMRACCSRRRRSPGQASSTGRSRGSSQ